MPMRKRGLCSFNWFI